MNTVIDLTSVPDSPDSSCQTKQVLSKQVIQAVKKNNLYRLKELRKSGDCLFNLCDNFGNTLLHIAIKSQRESNRTYGFNQSQHKLNTLRSKILVFEYLLTVYEIPKEARNSEGNSPLMEAFQFEDYSPEYARLLIKYGCKVNGISEDGNTLLHWAIKNKWIDIAELLIELGCDVNRRNSTGETPLHIASWTGLVDEVWMLLFYGADPNSTFIKECPYTSYTTYTLACCFDVVTCNSVTPEVKKIFDKLDCCKNFSLMTFIEAMERDTELFSKLLEITYDINYSYDDLREFCRRISYFEPELFELFIKNFPYVVEEMIDRCCLDEAFICDNPYLDKYTRNLFSLFESDIVDSLVNEINCTRLPIIGYVIDSFSSTVGQLEALTQVLCCMLSHGVNMNAEALNDIYFQYGYCQLFKIMLHMDIKNINRCFNYKHVIPRIIYDVNLTTDLVITEVRYDEPTIYRISKYFALPKLKKQIQISPDVPTLVELARNRARQFIIDKFKTENSMQFYTILQKLPIAEIHKKIISFEKQLYKL